MNSFNVYLWRCISISLNTTNFFRVCFFFWKIVTVLIEFMKSTISLSDVNFKPDLWTMVNIFMEQSVISFMFSFDTRWEKKRRKTEIKIETDKRNKTKMFYDFRKWNKIQNWRLKRNCVMFWKLLSHFHPK